MIVRIMHEGQYRIDDEGAKILEKLDGELADAIDRGDEGGFARVLSQALESVHDHGIPLDSDALVPSELTLPAPHSTLDEVRELLSEDTQEA